MSVQVAASPAQRVGAIFYHTFTPSMSSWLAEVLFGPAAKLYIANRL